MQEQYMERLEKHRILSMLDRKSDSREMTEFPKFKDRAVVMD